mgnify:CR=1 FL=1
MPLYADASIVVDCAYLVAVTPGHGDGQYGEDYWLLCMLNIGGKPKKMFADYATAEARDAAFTALSAQLVGDKANAEEPQP